jgi:hypothetical protein
MQPRYKAPSYRLSGTVRQRLGDSAQLLRVAPIAARASRRNGRVWTVKQSGDIRGGDSEPSSRRRRPESAGKPDQVA